MKYQAGLRRKKRREEREKGLKRRQRRHVSVSTDLRNRGTQAYWAMHVDAMNWSGMGVRECAAALRLSPYALRKWPDADLARCFALRRSRDRSSRGCRCQGRGMSDAAFPEGLPRTFSGQPKNARVQQSLDRPRFR